MDILGQAVNWALVAQLTAGGIILGSTYAILGLSFGIIYSTTEIFHFAHSVVYAVTAYAAVVFFNRLHIPWYISIFLAMGFSILVGMAIEHFGYKPMRKSNGPKMVIFIVSLGLATLAPNLFQIVFGVNNQTFNGYQPIPLSWGAINITSLDIITVVVCWSVIGAVLFILKNTRQGLAIKAVRSNPQMARSVGISSDRIYLLVFGIGSFLISIPAILFLMNGVAYPSMGLTPVLYGLIAVFVGGVGSMAGSVLGGFALGMLTSLSAIWLSSDLQSVFVFAVLFVFVIVRPQGILGKAFR